MKSLELTVEPSKKGADIDIDILSCLHAGHTCHEREKAEQAFEEVYETPDRFLVSVGDNQDNGTKNSPGASWAENTHNPREQLILTAALYKPLIKRKKVLWMQDSNHSNRIFKETGFMTSEEALWRLLTGRGVTSSDWDIIERYFRGRIKGRDQEEAQNWIQSVLDGMKQDPDEDKIPLWGGWQTLVKLHVGKAEYMIHSMHGEGTGVTAASALQAVMKQKDIAHADLFFRGHHHKRVVADGSFARWSGPGKPVEFDRVGYITTGCFLGYHNSYGEAKGYAPLEIGMARVTLSSTSKKFKLSM